MYAAYVYLVQALFPAPPVRHPVRRETALPAAAPAPRPTPAPAPQSSGANRAVKWRRNGACSVNR